MKKLLLPLAFSAPFGLAAQVSVAPFVGFNVSGYTVDSKLVTSMDRYGMKAGIMMDIKCSDHFHLQPGVNYVMNGFKMTARKFSVPFASTLTRAAIVSINTLEMPLNAVFKTKNSGEGQFFISAGPYLGYNLSGKISIPIVTSAGNQIGDTVMPLSFGNDPFVDAMRILDLGVNANMGYEFQNGIFARAYYQRGFRDLGGSVYSYNYGFGIGYLIGKGANHPGHKKEKKEKKVNTRRTPFELQENE